MHLDRQFKKLPEKRSSNNLLYFREKVMTLASTWPNSVHYTRPDPANPKWIRFWKYDFRCTGLPPCPALTQSAYLQPWWLVIDPKWPFRRTSVVFGCRLICDNPHLRGFSYFPGEMLRALSGVWGSNACLECRLREGRQWLPDNLPRELSCPVRFFLLVRFCLLASVIWECCWMWLR